MSEDTTIILKKTTRDKLKMIGAKWQTYDDVVLELIRFKEVQVK